MQQLGNGVAEEALVLGLGVKVFARELDELGGGVVAGACELDELGDVGGAGEAQGGGGGGLGEVLRGELDDDFVGGGVGFVEVGGVAEAERGGFGGRGEGTGEFCEGGGVLVVGLNGGEIDDVIDVRLNKGSSQAISRAYSRMSRCFCSSPWP